MVGLRPQDPLHRLGPNALQDQINSKALMKWIWRFLRGQGDELLIVPEKVLLEHHTWRVRFLILSAFHLSERRIGVCGLVSSLHCREDNVRCKCGKEVGRRSRDPSELPLLPPWACERRRELVAEQKAFSCLNRIYL